MPEMQEGNPEFNKPTSETSPNRQKVLTAHERRVKILIRLYHKTYPWSKNAGEDDPFPGMVRLMTDEELITGIRLGRSGRLNQNIRYKFPRSTLLP